MIVELNAGVKDSVRKINIMVIGNGMIANRFMSYKNDEDIIIFASGVSNSKDTS